MTTSPSFDQQQQRRMMTSAIQGMTVADVRRGLGEARKRWKQRTVDSPMYPTDFLSNGMMIQTFALRFELGHHQKRHNKNKRPATAAKNVSDDEDDSYSDNDLYNDIDSDSDELLVQQHQQPPQPKHMVSSIQSSIQVTPVMSQHEKEQSKRGRKKVTTSSSPTQTNTVQTTLVPEQTTLVSKSDKTVAVDNNNTAPKKRGRKPKNPKPE